MVLRLGYFPEFENAETILFGGDRGGLERLAALLAPLTTPEAPAVELHRHAQVSVWKPVHLTAMCDAEDRGVRREHDVDGVSAFVWQRSAVGWTSILEMLAGMSGAPAEGHQYLDTPHAEDAAVVMVSTEYSEAWWESHG